MRLTLLACAMLAGSAHAQSLDAYLKLRKSNGIFQAASVEALDTFVGSKVIEVQGLIKGCMKMDKRYLLLFERFDKSTDTIESSNPPDWLLGNEIPARLIVRADRADEFGKLKVELIGAAPEESIAAIEAAAAKKAASTKKVLASRSAIKREATIKSSKAREWIVPASEVTPIYAAYIKNYNKKLKDSEAYRIAEGVIGFSIHYGVDARLIMALLIAESGFNPKDTSHSGAMGLGQLMPGTAKDLGVKNPYDMVENLYGTVKLLSSHINHYRATTGDDFQSLRLALAAYNAGPGAVRRAGGIPPYRETQHYVKKIVGLYKQFVGLN